MEYSVEISYLHTCDDQIRMISVFMSSNIYHLFLCVRVSIAIRDTVTKATLIKDII